MTKSRWITTLMTCGLLGFLMSLPTASSAAEGEQFKVSVYENGPGSSELLAGDFAAAIAAASPMTRLPEPLTAYINLCVALIGSNQLEQAQVPCDRAVEHAQLRVTAASLRHYVSRKDALAKAHANRGVLRALYGDAAGALTDFDRVADQGRLVDIAAHNRGVLTDLGELADR